MKPEQRHLDFREELGEDIDKEPLDLPPPVEITGCFDGGSDEDTVRIGRALDDFLSRIGVGSAMRIIDEDGFQSRPVRMARRRVEPEQPKLQPKTRDTVFVDGMECEILAERGENVVVHKRGTIGGYREIPMNVLRETVIPGRWTVTDQKLEDFPATTV